MPRQRNIITAVGQIDQQRDPAGQLVRREAQIFARDQPWCDFQHAIDRQIAQNPARDIAHARDAGRGQPERDIDRRAAQPPLPRRPDIFETGLVKRGALRRQQIIEPRGRKRPVEHCFQRNVPPGHVTEQRVGTQQTRIDAHRFETAVGQVDDPVCADGQCVRRHGNMCVETAIVQHRIALHTDDRRGQAHQFALRDQ